MSQAYSDPSRESDAYSLPDVEVFFVNANDPDFAGIDGDSTETLPAGWYYWFCFPGCLPDGGPIGPFDTEENAMRAVREDIQFEPDNMDAAIRLAKLSENS